MNNQQTPRQKQPKSMSISQADANKIYEILQDVVKRMDRMEQQHSRDMQEMKSDVARVDTNTKAELAQVTAEVAGIKHQLKTLTSYHWVLVVTVLVAAGIYLLQSYQLDKHFREEQIKTQQMQVNANKELRAMQIQASKDIQIMREQSDREFKRTQKKTDARIDALRDKSEQDYRDLAARIDKSGNR